MQQIRTTGDLRGFLGEILVGIRDGEIDRGQAESIAKVASQINLSLSVEVNAAIQLKRLGEGDTVAGAMLLVSDEEPTLEIEGKAADWVKHAVARISKFRRTDQIIEFGSSQSAALEKLMRERPELHAEVTAAIDAATTRIRPQGEKVPENEADDADEPLPDELWCDQCDGMVALHEAATCKSRHCSLRAAA